jgi:hypothetical protein
MHESDGKTSARSTIEVAHNWAGGVWLVKLIDGESGRWQVLGRADTGEAAFDLARGLAPQYPDADIVRRHQTAFALQ